MSRVTTAAVVAVALMFVGACAGEPEDPLGDAEPPEEDPVEPEPDPDEPPRVPADPPDDGGPEDPGDGSTALLDDEVQAAIDDAVERTGADRADVSVVTTELVTWPDGSLGCPEPGQMYTMALVEGYRIVLEVDGRELAYHGQDGSPPSYCARPSDPAPGDGRVTS